MIFSLFDAVAVTAILTTFAAVRITANLTIFAAVTVAASLTDLYGSPFNVAMRLILTYSSPSCLHVDFFR